MKNALAVLTIVACAVALAIWSVGFNYHECTKVGHGTFYCVLKVIR
jgi:hypothetical protein